MDTRPAPHARPERARLGVAALVLLVLFGGVVVSWSLRPGAPSTNAPPPKDGAGVALVDAEISAAGALDSGQDRQAAVAEVAAPSAHRDFEAIFADLVALHMRAIASAGKSGGTPADALAPEQVGAAAADLFQELLVAVPDAGLRVLHKVVGVPPPWQAERATASTVAVETQVVLRVGTLVLDFSLQRMTQEEPFRAGRAPLVHALLSGMAMHRPMAKLVHGLLHGEPYLEAAHEPALIEMAKTARGDLAYLAPMVRDLLVTLWGNLGSAADARIGDLLLHFEGGGDPAVRAAAVARLILVDRYRELVIARLLEMQDVELMQGACNAAARELPFDSAIQVLAALRSATENGHFLAYSVLAERSAEPLARHYEMSLGQSTQPRHREQVVAAVGHDRGHGPAVAQLAFDQDPDPRVRGVALLALAAHADAAAFRSRFERALADPSTWRSFLVSALRNHARRADVNWLDSVTASLLAEAGLSTDERAGLEHVRKTYLPR